MSAVIGAKGLSSPASVLPTSARPSATPSTAPESEPSVSLNGSTNGASGVFSVPLSKPVEMAFTPPTRPPEVEPSPLAGSPITPANTSVKPVGSCADTSPIAPPTVARPSETASVTPATGASGVSSTPSPIASSPPAKPPAPPPLLLALPLSSSSLRMNAPAATAPKPAAAPPPRPPASKPAPTRPDISPVPCSRMADEMSSSMSYNSTPSVNATTLVLDAAPATSEPISSKRAAAPGCNTSNVSPWPAPRAGIRISMGVAEVFDISSPHCNNSASAMA